MLAARCDRRQAHWRMTIEAGFEPQMLHSGEPDRGRPGASDEEQQLGVEVIQRSRS
jgi:hypothetical protein